MKVLHLTAHLGGGVGKALSGLVLQAGASDSGVGHEIVTFEEQEKTQFIDLIKSHGGKVAVCPSHGQLQELVHDADVVQLEWWNHPATLGALCTTPFPPMRLLVWSHISGLFNPIIPKSLIEAADRFVFTSPCSYEARTVSSLSAELLPKTGVVSSSGGFAGFPMPSHNDETVPLGAGYFGSLNFAKLHPQYVDFLAAVDLPGFSVKLIGDTMNRELLEEHCAVSGCQGMLNFRGYISNPVSELSSVNVLVYLLNPEHYGTTENALIEAMAMGIVPIVLNNPAERNIVTDRVTGLIVNTPEEFAEAIRWLAKNPDERHRIGCQAAASVRERFTPDKMEAGLRGHYMDLLEQPKKIVDFKTIFGSDPADWFLSCQGYPEVFDMKSSCLDGRYRFARYGFLEKSKGTVYHFLSSFPDDHWLQQWAEKVQLWRLH